MPKKVVAKESASEDSDSDSVSEGAPIELDPEKFMAALQPEVRKRVHGLQGIQKEWAAVHEGYVKEMTELEQKYEELYKPLFEKRRAIVSGEVEPTNNEVEDGAKIVELKEEGEDDATAKGDGTGVPDFWLRAMKNNDTVEDTLTTRDEDALKHLVDITSKNMDDPTKGFTLSFHFKENPYFEDKVLTKTYHQLDDDEVVLEKAEGCDIKWKKGKKLTVQYKQKKQKHKGGGKTRTVTKEEPCDSFFNFFSPPQMNLDDDEDEEDEDLEDMVEHDYDVGRNFKDKIIPKAVDWYTGKECDTETGGLMIMGDSDDDDDDGTGDVPPGDGTANPPECKQQ